MKIFVTGGSGFVGGYLIPKLVAHGYDVLALARSDTAIKKVESTGATSVKGDITDQTVLDNALRGCDVVIHAAATFEMWGDEAQFYKVNVEGTQKLVSAAQKNGVSRFIYISAASVIADGTPANMVDETYMPKQIPNSPYSKTKWLGEQHVLLANRPNFTTLSLRPPFIWGNGHSMIEEIRKASQKGRWVWIAGGHHHLATVHIDNLCSAILTSIHTGDGGEAYYITDGELMSIRQFLTEWMYTQGITLGTRSIPYWMAQVSASVLATIWRVLRLTSSPPITPTMVSMMGVELTVTDKKARQKLGYQNQLTIQEGLGLLKKQHSE
ncbi:MAG: NAD-dependent epimerase/dehydratase family protein [bacterium]|nr:NAD-dependent epimerase/dehydratase family protein [bacterium]